MLLAVAAAMVPAIAQASKTARSVSSGSVQISVSVAPRYKVLAVDAPSLAGVRPERHSDRLCLVTNSSMPTMPVKLVRPSAQWLDVGQAGLGAHEQIAVQKPRGAWLCSLIDDRSTSGSPNLEDRAGGRWLLVRPE